MRYFLVPKRPATEHGFQMATHRCVGPNMILNEIEVMNSPLLTGDAEERHRQLGGDMFSSLEQLKKVINP